MMRHRITAYSHNVFTVSCVFHDVKVRDEGTLVQILCIFHRPVFI
jgi:hypothetical protein